MNYYCISTKRNNMQMAKEVNYQQVHSSDGWFKLTYFNDICHICAIIGKQIWYGVVSRVIFITKSFFRETEIFKWETQENN